MNISKINIINSNGQLIFKIKNMFFYDFILKKAVVFVLLSQKMKIMF